MKSRIIIAIVFLSLGLIIAFVPENTTSQYKLSAAELLDEVKGETQFVHPDQVADMIVQDQPTMQLIDIRSKEEFEKYALPEAINIPLDNILSEEWKPYLNQDVYLNVFYSNGTTRANEAWMITRQLGYKNNYVLQGGLNYWVETVLNPEKPDMTSPDDEFARYNYRKAAGNALGGGGTIEQKQDVEPAKLPPIRKGNKKKMVQGGCS
ncbi:MAG: rhodanese-like domain-containing protein [Bacteroidales bacterium]|nr:rhodanese-like domain-containing protein [Bacteroidales bacterium]MCF8343233.1 rhodanese-like domain-containing protein [Bacteroidales bacterium]MCF8374858.1 rhodanese-like domain-containing protein [Bacteroidales bacterium]MCF8399738.1 rhodanese-like domain-containing protein [Bacteroidales bacterium]